MTENVGRRFLQDAQELQRLVRSEVADERQIRNVPHQPYTRLSHTPLVARAEARQDREQVAAARLDCVNDQTQVVECAAQ